MTQTNAVRQADGGEGPESADEMKETPASELRNALQILVLAGPNWLTPVQAFAVRERIEAAIRLLGEVSAPQSYICWDCGSEFTPTTTNQRECVRCYVQGKL